MHRPMTLQSCILVEIDKQWNICSTQRSPVHRVGMQGIWNRDTRLYPLHNNSSAHLTTITEVRRSGRITDGMRKEWRALRDPVLSSSTHLAGIALPSTAWVRLNRLRTVVTRLRSSLHKWGMAVWVWQRSNRWPYCLPMSIHRPLNGLHG